MGRHSLKQLARNGLLLLLLLFGCEAAGLESWESKMLSDQQERGGEKSHFSGKGVSMKNATCCSCYVTKEEEARSCRCVR